MKKFILLSLSFLVLSCSSDDTNEVSNDLASLATPVLLDLSNTRALIESTITNDGGALVTERGIVWSTSQNPTLEDNVVPTDVRATTFSLIIFGLTPNTQYFVRTFAVNELGISYSEELSLTTTENVSVVFEGNVGLFSQQDVNNVAVFGITDITGNLRISDTGTQDIFDLSPLVSLQNVGALEINGLFLDNIDGLENLESIGNSLQVYDTSNLANLSALDNAVLDENSTVEFVDNDALVSLDGPAYPGEVTSLMINVNPSLVDISGLESITQVNGTLTVDSTPVTSLMGLQNVTNISETLNIKETEITSLMGLESLLDIGGDLIVETNLELISLTGSSSLINVGGNMNIRYNDALLTTQGLSSLTSIEGEVRIWGNDELQDLNGFESLGTIGSLCWILENPNLENIDGLSGLSSTGSFFQIIRNDGLVNLDGLANLVSVNGFLNIIDNTLLADFCGLQPILTNSGVDNTLSISGNAFNPSEQDIIDGNCSL